MKLEFSNRRRTKKTHNYMEIRKDSPEQPMDHEKLKGKLNILKQMKMETQHTKTCGMHQKQF